MKFLSSFSVCSISTDLSTGGNETLAFDTFIIKARREKPRMSMTRYLTTYKKDFDFLVLMSTLFFTLMTEAVDFPLLSENDPTEKRD